MFCRPLPVVASFCHYCNYAGRLSSGTLQAHTIPGALMSKPRVHLRLDGKLLALLEASAREQATSKTAALEEALGPYC